MECPVCRTDSSGRYCPRCGAALRGAHCEACDAELVAGARYCTQCGELARRRGPLVPWVVAGVAMTALILVLMLPQLRPRAPAAGVPLAADAPMTTASAPADGAPPPLTGSPREQADRLFNRIMEERSAGNDERAAFFLPMALAAYRQAGELDADGLYHLSVLESAGGQHEAARATAERILAQYPDHLLGLATAGEAAAAAGDTASARQYYSRFLDRFDEESARRVPEYIDHARVLPEYRRAAEQFLSF